MESIDDGGCHDAARSTGSETGCSISAEWNEAVPVSGTRAQALAELRHAGGSAPRGGWLWCRYGGCWGRGWPATKASQRSEIGQERNIWEKGRGRSVGGTRSPGQPEDHREEDQVDFGHCHRGRCQYQTSTAQDHQYTRKKYYSFLFPSKIQSFKFKIFTIKNCKSKGIFNKDENCREMFIVCLPYPSKKSLDII